MYPKTDYRHNLDFTVLSLIGKTPLMLNPQRATLLVPQIIQIMESTVSVAAEKLSAMLQDQYETSMLGMREYSNFPRYIEVMRAALSMPWHRDVYYDRFGVIQAKFIDTNRLGGIEELISIQQQVVPERGTLGAWKRLYDNWESGTDKNGVYESTINQRLDLMVGTAPFMELVEDGNARYDAYPQNEGAHLLLSFRSKYKSEMHIAYTKALSIIVSLVVQGGQYFTATNPDIVIHNNKRYYGNSWISPRSGNKIFIISGTERYGAGGILVGKGMVYNKQGGFLRRFFGRIPKI